MADRWPFSRSPSVSLRGGFGPAMGSAEQPTVQLYAAMLTDVGVVREHNEDSAYVDEKYHFFIVADGMGGHAAGEVASAMAVQQVREALEVARGDIVRFALEPSEKNRKALVKVLESAVLEAHKAVYERGTNETDKHGMGTTLDVVLVAGPEAFVAHVGDSRTYLVRDSQATAITTDHTVAEVLVIEGKLSPEEAQHSPLRTILVNAIGVAPDVGIEMAHIPLQTGDQLLVCSDGLHDYFPDNQELAEHLCNDDATPDDALAQLVNMAKDRGGHDNITGIVVLVEKCDRPVTRESALSNMSASTLAAFSDGVPDEIERADTLQARVEGQAFGKKAVEMFSDYEEVDTLDSPKVVKSANESSPDDHATECEDDKKPRASNEPERIDIALDKTIDG